MFMEERMTTEHKKEGTVALKPHNTTYLSNEAFPPFFQHSGIRFI